MQNSIEVKPSIFVKALNEVGTDKLDEVLEAMDYCLDEIYENLCNPHERILTAFMSKLITVVDRLEAEDKKKYYNPDEEYLKKHPDTDIFKSND